MIPRGYERSERGVQIGKSEPLERVQLANQVQGLGLRTAQMAEKKIILVIFVSCPILACLFVDKIKKPHLNMFFAVNTRNNHL